MLPAGPSRVTANAVGQWAGTVDDPIISEDAAWHSSSWRRGSCIVTHVRPLLAIDAQNFRSLRRVSVTLRPLNVLVGPNQAGKTNFLDLLAFLGDSARNDLQGALENRGGFDRVRFRGQRESGSVVIHVKSNVTTHSHEGAPDEYRLSFWTRKARNSTRQILMRDERFTFKRTKGRGRRITVSGTKAEFMETTGETTHPER